MSAQDERLHVCVIISSFRPLIGGAEQATEQLCRSLRERGVSVLVLTRQQRSARSSECILGVPVRRLGLPRATKLGALSFGLHSLWLLATELRKYRTVHVQSPDTPLLVGLIAKLALRRRLLVTLHGTTAYLFSSARSHHRRRLRFRLMGRWADAVAVLSPTMADEIMEAGFPADRVRLLPNGVDLSVFNPPSADEQREARRVIGLENSSIVYLFVGRLVGLKRVDLLLDAWAALDCSDRGTLLIVGAGPEADALQRRSQALGLTDVRFEGSTDDVRPYLSAADVFVLPSDTEALSCALLEAMASGLAVLVSDLEANRALVRHGENGLLFKPNDSQELTSGLALLRSARRRRELGDRAVATIETGFSLDATADLHVSLYREARPGKAA